VPQQHDKLSFFCLTDKGHKRQVNEDAFLVDETTNLWVLADGMGGYGYGDIASKIVVNHIIDCIRQNYVLTESIYSSHDAVLDAAEAGRGQWGMGSTVVALQVKEANYEIAWVGDSRAYLFKDKHLEQLTKDHSLVQEMVDQGMISEQEAAFHPQKNIISQAVGSPETDDMQVDTITGNFLTGQLILLCSDGLSSEVSQSDMESIFQQTTSIEIKAKQLIKAALAAGGKDNITVIIVAR